MKYLFTARARADLGGLSTEERAMFAAAARSFSHACDRDIDPQARATWPAGLRVKKVRGAPGVWEMTWSFAGPDGRATWEWSTVDVVGDDEPAILWRRIGNHRVFDNP